MNSKALFKESRGKAPKEGDLNNFTDTRKENKRGCPYLCRLPSVCLKSMVHEWLMHYYIIQRTSISLFKT